MPEAFHITRFVPQIDGALGTLTRFGGQPLWSQETDWPLSEETGKPLRFVGQIDLSQAPAHLKRREVIYFFFEIYDDKTDVHHLNNNLILRQTKTATPFHGKPGPVANEQVWTLEVQTVNEPDWQEMQELALAAVEGDEIDTKLDDHKEKFGGPKLGGTPIWPEDILMDDRENWHLVMQIPEYEFYSSSPNNFPIIMDYGDGGTGWLLLSRDGKDMEFTWTSN